MKLLTKENAKVVEDFQKHYFINAYKKVLIILAILLVLGILFLTIGFDYYGVFLIVFSIVLGAITPLIQKMSNNKLNKSYEVMMQEKLVELEFLDDKFSLKCYINDEMISSSIVYYKNIFKIEETPKYFFVFIAMNQSICVVKEDMDESQINDLRGILQSNCPKYKEFKK